MGKGRCHLGGDGVRKGEALFQTQALIWTLIEGDSGIHQGPSVGREQVQLLRLEKSTERLPGGAKGAMASTGPAGCPLGIVGVRDGLEPGSE